jgi:hypothetical protein
VSKKIRKTQIPSSSKSGIKPTQLIPIGISFSFKYYQDGHEWFHCREKGASYLLTLLDRLKSLSGLSVRELLTNRSSALRCHPIDWDGTSEAGFGLPNEEQLVDTPYQFSLSANEHGRVHGFFIDEVFYIVWLDPDHLLYSGKG